MTDRLALLTLIAIASVSLGKTVLDSMAVLGEISISGILQKVDEGLTNVLQACLDNGARKVLLPIFSVGDLREVPAELIGSPGGAARKEKIRRWRFGGGKGMGLGLVRLKT